MRHTCTKKYTKKQTHACTERKKDADRERHIHTQKDTCINTEIRGGGGEEREGYVHMKTNTHICI